jgi:2-amino-1-hydroxyethylphosphonate dioxygenase (glycine-forming)
MTTQEINQTADEIIRLYELHGAEDYIGEPVSQLEHMSQSAQLAEREGYDDEVMLAAFLHDIGHMVPQEHAASMDGYGTVSHEKIGADYLRAKGFSEKIAQLVENHVQAKRYLTLRNPDYYDRLSEASKKTLEFQGGRMTDHEATLFEQDVLFDLSLRMRTWDEMAKEEAIPLIDLRVIREKIWRHLQSRMQGV